ncbi:MAG TPA: DNA-binding protein [Erysipelotrichaceae bacterium]|nr:DNA-binding protein [Erysipelotrichaceae bacterium]
MTNKNERYNNLLDWYEGLLTDKQKEIAYMYFREDFSLSEIAEHTKSSRSAVHDSVQRVESLLDKYEDNLQCYQHFILRQTIYQKLNALKIDEVDNLVERLNEIE